MNFMKIIILALVLSFKILAVNSAMSKRRMNFLRKFHNGPKSKINKSSFVSSNGQAMTKNKIMILPREQKIIELHRKIKIMLNDREKNRFKLFYWAHQTNLLINVNNEFSQFFETFKFWFQNSEISIPSLYAPGCKAW